MASTPSAVAVNGARVVLEATIPLSLLIVRVIHIIINFLDEELQLVRFIGELDMVAVSGSSNLGYPKVVH